MTFLDKQCSVTLHQHGFRYQCDRGSVVMLSGLVCRDGQSAVLRVGRYDLAAMTAAGAKNDDVSSVTVSDGCQVTLFENADFSGWNATFSPGRHNINQMEKTNGKATNFKNDATSSVEVTSCPPTSRRLFLLMTGCVGRSRYTCHRSLLCRQILHWR